MKLWQNQQKPIIIALAILGLITVSAASGAISGYVISSRLIAERPQATGGFILPSDISTNTAAVIDISKTEPTTTIRLVPLTSIEPAPRVVPDSISERNSTVGTLYAAPAASNTSTRINAQNEIARVVALTSDGWFAVPYQIVKSHTAKQLLLVHNQRVYPIEQAIYDEATSVVFLKTAATNLPVASFARHYSMRTGIALWFEPSSKQFIPSSLISVNAEMQPTVKYSDETDRRMVVQGELRDQEIGAPLWDANGALVGLVESADAGRMNIIPASAISTSLQSLVSNNEVKHATLGIYGVDQSFVIHDPESKEPTRGVKITPPDQKTLAIEKESAAEQAELQVGDVILQVDRDILDGSMNLGDILLQFYPGASVTLRVWRAGEEVDVPVTFGSHVTSKLLP